MTDWEALRQEVLDSDPVGYDSAYEDFAHSGLIAAFNRLAPDEFRIPVARPDWWPR